MAYAMSHQVLTLREIDRLIAERIFGLRPCKEWKQVSLGSAGGPALMHGDWTKPVKHDYECYPDIEEFETVQGTLGGAARYATEIAAAWQLVDKIHERGFGIVIARNAEDSKYEVEVRLAKPAEFAKELRRVIAREATAPLAICLSALKANGLDVTVRT